MIFLLCVLLCIVAVLVGGAISEKFGGPKWVVDLSLLLTKMIEKGALLLILGPMKLIDLAEEKELGGAFRFAFGAALFGALAIGAVAVAKAFCVYAINQLPF